MSDESIAARIERLVSEEHELDRCWDLLRQRRALRDADTVERYQQ